MTTNYNYIQNPVFYLTMGEKDNTANNFFNAYVNLTGPDRQFPSSAPPGATPASTFVP